MGSTPSSSATSNTTTTTTINMENHWEGPYGMLVPNSVNYVIAEDGYNTHYKDGGVTEMYMTNAPKMNKDIYLAQYATFKSDGYYYHK